MKTLDGGTIMHVPIQNENITFFNLKQEVNNQINKSEGQFILC